MKDETNTKTDKFGACGDCGNETFESELKANRGMCIPCNGECLELEADQRDEW